MVDLFTLTTSKEVTRPAVSAQSNDLLLDISLDLSMDQTTTLISNTKVKHAAIVVVFDALATFAGLALFLFYLGRSCLSVTNCCSPKTEDTLLAKQLYRIVIDRNTAIQKTFEIRPMTCY